MIELGELFFSFLRVDWVTERGKEMKNATNDEQKKKKKEIFSRFDRTWAAEDESLRLCLAKRKRERERVEMCAREL